MTSIGNRTEQQIALDRCVGKIALDLRAIAWSMEESYQRIDAARAIVIASCAPIVTCPKALELSNRYLAVEQKIQLVLSKWWRAKQIQWNPLFWKTCTSSAWAWADRLPDFPFETIRGNYEDFLNPLPRRRQTEMEIGIQTRFPQLRSKTKIEFDRKWYAFWSQ